MSTTSVKEIRLDLPLAFDGKSESYHAWIVSIESYLTTNEAIYDNDQKKIAFTLSFMKKGPAQGWATTFAADAIQAKTWGKFADFKIQLEKSFLSTDLAANSLTILQTITQGESVLDYINSFKIAAHRSGIKDDTVLIRLFSEGLEPRLARRIYGMDTPPTTIDDWYTKAEKFQAQWAHTQTIRPRKQRKEEPRRNNSYRYTPPTPKTRDPNAMDIDAVQLAKLTPAERTRCIKEGRCFRCRQPGHTAATCPSNNARPRPKNTNKVDSLPKLIPVDDDEDEEEVARVSFSLDKDF